MDQRIIQYFDGKLPEKERIRLLQDIDSDKNLKKDMLHVQNMQAILSLSKKNDTQKANEQLQQLKKRQKNKQIYHFVKHATGYAAAITVLIIVTWMVATSSQQSPINQVTTTQQELYVPAGQRARITLPDGSTVWVNAGSVLSYPSAFENKRQVHLKGEAFFDVACNPDKPFIVSTDELDIRALGTQFNVYSYSKAAYTSTTLLNGSVKIYKPGKESEGTFLQPNQQLVYSNGEFKLETSIDNDQLLWKEGIYCFKKEKLEHIIKKLEIYYDVEIIVKNPRILQYEYTGKFRQRDGVVEILQIIQKIHEFNIYKDENLNLITLS